jgi:hypothetical protein
MVFSTHILLLDMMCSFSHSICCVFCADIPLLSDADLSSLVPKLGPRRRLLAAIQSSNSASSTTTEAPRPSFHINSTQPPTVQSLLASPTHKRPMSATTPKSSHLTLNTVEERDESPLRRVHNSMALLTPKASTPKAGTPKALSARSPPPQQVSHLIFFFCLNK